MTRCIFCNAEISKPKKEWEYRRKYYFVRQYDCPHCFKTFNEYFHNSKLSHTIPKNPNLEPSTLRKIIAFLRSHDFATTEEIATALGLKLEETFAALAELENRSRIEKSTC